MHIKVSHEKIKDHKCDQCGWEFGYKSDLTNHIRVIHNDGKTLACDVCDNKYSKRSYLNYHLEKAHNIPWIRRTETVARPTKTRVRKRTSKKKVASSSTDGSKTIDKVERVKPSVEPSIAPSIVPSIAPSLEPLVEPSSNDEDTSSNHVDVGEIPDVGTTSVPISKFEHKCKFCSEEFENSGSLFEHIERLHADEVKIESCEICSKKFLSAEDLEKHGSEHRRVKIRGTRVTCDLCGVSYYDANTLRRHKRNVHPGFNFTIFFSLMTASHFHVNSIIFSLRNELGCIFW
jgi:hypothetical protein